MKRFLFEEQHLGTPIVLQIVTEDENLAKDVARQAFDECARIEKNYSRFLENNALARLNSTLETWQSVDEELYGLLAFGLRLQEKTSGAFDLSVKTLLETWGYDKNYSFKASSKGTEASPKVRSSPAIELGEDRLVRLSAPVELGGLGKGYAIDRMTGLLSVALGRSAGFCINAGGDLFVKGSNEEGRPWKIVFEHPQDIHMAIGEVELDPDTITFKGMALASSSPSRRRWKNDEKSRHHLVDPRTGEPANKMLAVYTQASDALLADAYSTALFVLGFEEARALIPELPVEAMLISPQGAVWQSSGFLGNLYGPTS